MNRPLVSVKGVCKDYRLPTKYMWRPAPLIRALHGIDLDMERGSSLGIVGESGCGKSTLARIVMALEKPTCGTVIFEERDIFQLSVTELKGLRRNFQMVFQDPYGSLNPKMDILDTVAEPLNTMKKRLSRTEREERVEQVLTEVGLKSTDMGKFPHEFSGGQRQRIGIARALVTRPSLIVADEPVSALDVSVQAQVLNLMMELQEKYTLSYLFISHDLSVVEYVTDQIAVLYAGRIMERGSTKSLFRHPLHPYTRMLLQAVPSLEPSIGRSADAVSSFQGTERSCPFLGRCCRATEACVDSAPKLAGKKEHRVACHHVP